MKKIFIALMLFLSTAAFAKDYHIDVEKIASLETKYSEAVVFSLEPENDTDVIVRFIYHAYKEEVNEMYCALLEYKNSIEKEYDEYACAKKATIKNFDGMMEELPVLKNYVKYGKGWVFRYDLAEWYD